MPFLLTKVLRKPTFNKQPSTPCHSALKNTDFSMSNKSLGKAQLLETMI